MDIKIEKIQPSDFEKIYEMIREFSDFQNARKRVSVTLDKMMEQKDFIFGYVAKDAFNQIIGYTNYSFIYYSWVGKSIYLDDLYVKPSFRGKGIGKKLMKKVFDIARKEKCDRVRWQVSNWNSKAIEFYKKIGARIDDTELNCDMILNNS